MAFTHFRVGPVEGLQFAELTGVPDLLVITGPNGSGKSTLLEQLWRQSTNFTEPNTHVIFLGPNRPWRRTTLNAAAQYAIQTSLRLLLELPSVPGFQYVSPGGFALSGLPRGKDTPDDAQALVKLSIVRLEADRRQAITAVYDAHGGQVPTGSLPDVFAPLQELITTLLPHLQFAGVDTTNSDDLKVLFRKLDNASGDLIDIDALSSGEKAVIALFMPFVETRIERLLSHEMVAEGSPQPRPVAIIDEPELHLHPALQLALVSYVRQLTQAGEAQFILATHSTSIMDALDDKELYVLAPPSTVGDGNQLSRLSSSAERLALVRELTGSTYAVTRCRPIVFMEGESAAARQVSDQRVIETLIPEALSWVPVPTEGRFEAIKAAKRLRDPYLTELPGIPVFALVDRDQQTSPEPDFVISWPVCMVENLLLDPEAIWRILEPNREAAGVTSPGHVETLLRTYALQQRDDEIRLRVRAVIRQPKWRLPLQRPGDADDLPTRASTVAQENVDKAGGEAALVQAHADATVEVDEIIQRAQELERFRGKELLKRFYDAHVKHAGFSYPMFVYQLALTVKDTDRLARLVAIPVKRTQRYVPKELPALLAQCSEALETTNEADEARAVQIAAAEARQSWERDLDDSIDRIVLRTRLFGVARAIKQLGDENLAKSVYVALAQLGAEWL